MSKRKNNQLPLHVLKKFRVIYGSVRQHFREIEHSCGVTGSQLWILQAVGNHPGIAITELSEKLSIHQSTCSQLIDKLVSRNLVDKERSKEDQRRVGLRLTPHAAKTLKNAPGPAEGLLPEALQGLPESSLLALDSALLDVIGQLSIRDDRFAEKHLSDM